MRKIIEITDPEDPCISAYRNIRERDLVGRQGRFVAEGRVVLNVLFSVHRFETESVLVLENRLPGLEPLLGKIPQSVPLYLASRRVMDAIAGFPVHRGILAIGRRRADETVEGLLGAQPRRSIVLLLAGIANHDNMGALFRNAAAFGAGAVLLDRHCCDPLYRKAIRVSVGAALKVPFAKGGDIDQIADQAAVAGYKLFALSPGARHDLVDIEPVDRVALTLGSEGRGLPNEIVERMTGVSIGMAPGFDSLNVAAASAIALHHFTAGARRFDR